MVVALLCPITSYGAESDTVLDDVDSSLETISVADDIASEGKYIADYDPVAQCFDYKRPLNWGSIEYLSWWGQRQNLPALVTTSPNGTPQNEAGVLGFDDTTILAGGESVYKDPRSGVRLTIGYWLDETERTAIEGRFFSLGEADTSFSATSADNPILARPFYDVWNGQENSQLVAYPNLRSGNIDVNTQSDILGGDVYLRRLLKQCGESRIDLIAGYQFSRLDEGLTIANSSTFLVTSGNIPIGTTVDMLDQFDVSNEFHGAQIGLLTESRHGYWTFRLLTKLGLGNMRQTVRVSGSTTTTEPGDPADVDSGGLLSQDSNIGERILNDFAVVPELGLQATYKVNHHLDIGVGYSLIYWSSMTSISDAIDRSINLTQRDGGPLMGDARPNVSLTDSGDFWLQGLNVSLGWHF